MVGGAVMSGELRWLGLGLGRDRCCARAVGLRKFTKDDDEKMSLT